MTAWHRRTLGVLTVVALVAGTSQTARGYATLGSTWTSGNITMHLQLTGGSGLADGSANFNAVVASAMSICPYRSVRRIGSRSNRPTTGTRC